MLPQGHCEYFSIAFQSSGFDDMDFMLNGKCVGSEPPKRHGSPINYCH